MVLNLSVIILRGGNIDYTNLCNIHQFPSIVTLPQIEFRKRLEDNALYRVGRNSVYTETTADFDPGNTHWFLGRNPDFDFVFVLSNII